MAISTNLKSLAPRREVYKREITLVSSGFYNQKSFPGGKITVYPWDNAVDDWFQTRLRQPNREYALWEAVEKVANMNGASHREMPIGDIMTVLMVSRSIRHDCVVEYTATCPHCQRKTIDKIAIPAELAKIGEKKPDYSGSEPLTLPDSQDVVVIRVMTVKDEILISERSPEDKKVMPDATALVLVPIITVGGGKPDTIQELVTWYEALSPKDASALAKARANISPQLDPDIHIVCDGCQKEFTHTLDLQHDFFRGA